MRDEITRELKQAFASDLKDTVKPFTVIRRMVTDDDWLINDTQYKTLKFDGVGVFTAFSSREIDGETIQQGDIKLIALQADNQEIRLDDEIDGKSVIGVSHDPANVTYIVQLRG